jgi:hypothetical protein
MGEQRLRVNPRAGAGPAPVREQLIERDGHCAISPDEVARGFASLRAWIDTGVTPKTGCVQ